MAVTYAQTAQQLAQDPSNSVIIVPNPSSTDAGIMANMTDAQVQKALSDRAAGKNVIITATRGESFGNVNRVLDAMLATKAPATVNSFSNTGHSIGFLTTSSGNSLTGAIGNLVSDFGPALATALAAGYGLNALGSAGTSGAAALPSGGMTATGSIPSAGLGGTGMTEGLISSALNPATAGNIGLASGLGTTAAGITEGTIASALGSSAASTLAGAGVTQSVLNNAVQQAATNPSLLQQISTATGLSPSTLTQIASTGLGMLGSYIQGSTAQDAAKTAADAQIRAAQIAADAAKFRPVGVTTRFGSSNFGYDAQGNLISAGYTPSADITRQQNVLQGISDQYLTQYQNAKAATVPMKQTAQTLFGLGQGYLATTPQQQAAKFMADQQALLSTSRDRQLANLQNTLAQQGRLGLATGATGMMGAANPELEAFYNAQRQQDLQLAAQATQGGMDYARFGAGLVGSGGQMLQDAYGTQTAAYTPYQTALGGITNLEQLAQQPMDIGTSIGAKTSTAAADAGRLLGQGVANAATTMQPANAYSPWGALLTGAGSALKNY